MRTRFSIINKSPARPWDSSGWASISAGPWYENYVTKCPDAPIVSSCCRC